MPTKLKRLFTGVCLNDIVPISLQGGAQYPPLQATVIHEKHLVDRFRNDLGLRRFFRNLFHSRPLLPIELTRLCAA